MIEKFFSACFYDKKNSINPSTIKNQEVVLHNLTLIFQHQVHQNKGIALSNKNVALYKKCLCHNSDYIITNLTHIGIGVLTADCLPIAIADKKNKAIGIIHAGWRGTVSKIIEHTINHMTSLYNTNISDLEFFFGPCALPCCYEVDKPFEKQLPVWAKEALKDNHFDIPMCNTLLLNKMGVSTEQINQSKCICTLCNDNFCSYRKNPGNETRQMSIIWLH